MGHPAQQFEYAHAEAEPPVGIAAAQLVDGWQLGGPHLVGPVRHTTNRDFACGYDQPRHAAGAIAGQEPVHRHPPRRVVQHDNPGVAGPLRQQPHRPGPDGLVGARPEPQLPQPLQQQSHWRHVDWRLDGQLQCTA
eukprot:scaffold159458_cov52-Prasinocladus_malaysianus.AAC.1